MERIVILGKGGIGKSTIAVNLAAFHALQGKKVILIGCDPKHDTTRMLAPRIETFMEQVLRARDGHRLPSFTAEELCVRGRLGIDCVEAGGPEPGVGCAGRGISLMLETFQSAGLLDGDRYDVCLFDVLGDVVCGGFAAPLRRGFGEKVLIVASEELMSLYAANNIARSIRTYAPNGVYLAGLVANARGSGAGSNQIDQLAAAIGARVLERLPNDPELRRAERAGDRTLMELAPDSPFSAAIRRLALRVAGLTAGDASLPTPLEDEAFFGGVSWQPEGGTT